MSKPLTKHINVMLRMYEELGRTLPPDAYGQKLPNIRSNTVGSQLQCVIGVREMWTTTMETGESPGFHPSLSKEQTSDGEAVIAKLAETAELVRATLSEKLSEAQEDQALSLLEHESGHTGQLLRYLFALDVEIPRLWVKYFDLE
jgi:uncharacterized damage-inducible protein DinB